MDQRSQRIIRVTIVGSVVNLLLTAAKLLTGFLGHSAAMIADGIHSLSDLLSDLIVIIFVRIASRKQDHGHAYGHGKFETLASILVSIILLVVACKLIVAGIGQTLAVLGGHQLPPPSWIALVAALVSILLKEWLYRITLRIGQEEQSNATITNAWHHRTDAFSSIAVLVGIGGAMLLGGKWQVLDPLVCCGIGIFIVVIAIKMLFPGMAELMESSLPDAETQEIADIISHVDGINNVHELKTRRSGKTVIIDTHIVVNPNMSVNEAHQLTILAEEALRQRFGNDTQISIHVEPNVNAQ
ncbi:MAG: cation diffusion facilitator family transporter [Bacteroidales bacterium]|nr:cation diffusion facilitator family transporter [Bacteroidales bacterium]